MEYIGAFLLTGIVFAAVDAVWLMATANLYKNEFSSLLRPVPNFFAAIAFYILYVLGIVVFVLVPALSSGLWWQAAIHGALFGLVTYATYDLTNLATLKKWSVKITLIDMVWGTVLTGVSSVITFIVIKGWF